MTKNLRRSLLYVPPISPGKKPNLIRRMFIIPQIDSSSVVTQHCKRIFTCNVNSVDDNEPKEE